MFQRTLAFIAMLLLGYVLTAHADFDLSSIVDNSGKIQIIAAREDGGLQHFTLDPSTAPPTFTVGERFNFSIRYVGVAIIQSNYGNIGNFEVVAIRGVIGANPEVTGFSGEIDHFFLDNDDPNAHWVKG
jgi:hypothetical protein